MEKHQFTKSDKEIILKGYSFCAGCFPQFKKKFHGVNIEITCDDQTPNKPLIYSAQIQCNANKDIWRCLIFTFGPQDIKNTLQMIEEEVLRFLNIVSKNDPLFFKA